VSAEECAWICKKGLAAEFSAEVDGPSAKVSLGHVLAIYLEPPTAEGDHALSEMAVRGLRFPCLLPLRYFSLRHKSPCPAAN